MAIFSGGKEIGFSGGTDSRVHLDDRAPQHQLLAADFHVYMYRDALSVGR